MDATVVRRGDLVYLDTFSGLVKARVIAPGDRDSDVMVTVTATRHRVYRRGEVVQSSRTHVVPRSHVVLRSRQYRILGIPVRWELGS